MLAKLNDAVLVYHLLFHGLALTECLGKHVSEAGLKAIRQTYASTATECRQLAIDSLLEKITF